LAAGRTVATKGMTDSAFGVLTTLRAFFPFAVLADLVFFRVLTICFFFAEAGREAFIDFFLTFAGGLDLGGVGDA